MLKSVLPVSLRSSAEASLATRLLHAIITKSMLELIALCVIASLAAWLHFNPQLRGAVDVADTQRVAGWAADPLSPGEALEVQLFIDGNFSAARRANEKRDDLVSAGATRFPYHGFTFPLESLRLKTGQHLAQVYVVRPASSGSRILLPLAEKPLLFQTK